MGTILIVDDDHLVCALLEDALTRAGHLVIPCPNGREALHQLRSGPADMLITDLFMDDVDGLELIPKAKRLLPQLKIIAMSGGTPLTDRDYLPIARKLGADHTFHKPVDLDLLLKTVANLLGAS